jgi:hypothetical protein
METDRTERDLENVVALRPWEARAVWAKSVVANIRRRPEVDRSVATADGHYVYFAYSAGRIKIGTSGDLDNRKRGLTTQSPHAVTILLVIEGGLPLESRLHECLDSVRLHGEWFRLNSDMRGLLNHSLCRTGKRKLKRAEDDFLKWIETELQA